MIPPVLGDPLFPVTTAVVQRLRDEFAADQLATELRCEVTPHPELTGVVEARDPAPGVWLIVGTPDEVRAEVRRCALREWLAMLGRQDGAAD